MNSNPALKQDNKTGTVSEKAPQHFMLNAPAPQSLSSQSVPPKKHSQPPE